MSPELRVAFNTGTVRVHGLPLDELIERVGRAGYDAIEPWADEVLAFIASGGRVEQLVAGLQQHGLAVANLITLAPWISDDPEIRSRALADSERDIQLAVALGCGSICAAPIGESQERAIPLARVAERYQPLAELGRRYGVRVLLEMWSGSRSLRTLADLLWVAATASSRNVGLLLDVYHLHKSGSGFEGLALVDGGMMPVFHINDYPAEPAGPELRVRHRRLPGRGVAPLIAIVRRLMQVGFSGYLSLELFPDEPDPDADELIVGGLASMRALLHTCGATDSRTTQAGERSTKIST